MSITNKTHYELIKHFGTISERIDDNGNQCRKELNLVSWNGKEALFDIREWVDDRNIARSGLRFSEQELERLTDLLISRREDAHQQNSKDREV